MTVYLLCFLYHTEEECLENNKHQSDKKGDINGEVDMNYNSDDDDHDKGGDEDDDEEKSEVFHNDIELQDNLENTRQPYEYELEKEDTRIPSDEEEDEEETITYDFVQLEEDEEETITYDFVQLEKDNDDLTEDSIRIEEDDNDSYESEKDEKQELPKFRSKRQQKKEMETETLQNAQESFPVSTNDSDKRKEKKSLAKKKTDKISSDLNKSVKELHEWIIKPVPSCSSICVEGKIE